MKVAFRTDASLQIGTGHVMRCLTLADALVVRGAQCHFICREHQSNLIEFIRAKGYSIHVLPVASAGDANFSATEVADIYPAEPAHNHWLGATQSQDAQACMPILAALHPDWLIVDHYALDARWEHALKPYCHQLMVVDDLADRPHDCDLLLDQTFGRNPADYRPWVPVDCQLLCGSQYALLRPEFAALRRYSLQRRAQPVLHQLLITMGGVDKDNATGQVLEALQGCQLPMDCQIVVVMGATAPWLAEVQEQAQNMPWPTQVLVGVRNMAQLMADSDLAIGAAGATTWERCCLGLPSIMMVLAENQRHAASLLEDAKAARRLHVNKKLSTHLSYLIDEVVNSGSYLTLIGKNSSTITDGQGSKRITDFLVKKV